jgi:predicted secreted protein
MSEDRRSRKMIAVINCVINHNARAEGAARYPGANHDVLDILRKHGVGVIQMPCPEMVCLGLPRARAVGLSIRDVLDTPTGRSRCEELSRGVVDTIEEFQRNGCAVLAILGGDVESPGCAVPAPQGTGGEPMPGGRWGIFTGALRDELGRRGIHIPVRGIRDSASQTLQADLAWLDSTLARSFGQDAALP